jgi:hypothetical protein
MEAMEGERRMGTTARPQAAKQRQRSKSKSKGKSRALGARRRAQVLLDSCVGEGKGSPHTLSKPNGHSFASERRQQQALTHKRARPQPPPAPVVRGTEQTNTQTHKQTTQPTHKRMDERAAGHPCYRRS